MLNLSISCVIPLSIALELKFIYLSFAVNFCNHLLSVRFVWPANNPSNAVFHCISAIVLRLILCVCFFFLFSLPTLELVTFSECMPCVILKTRILFLAHYAHTHTRTNTNRRCELCCLLSPGLVHTRIPLAGATSRSPQSTTHTNTHSISFVLIPVTLLSLVLSPALPTALVFVT